MSLSNNRIVGFVARKLAQQTYSEKYADSPNLDSFGRLRTSQPFGLFDAQLTYDLQPLLFEQLTNGSGATITHDATNRCANISFNATSTGYSYMQSYEYFRYQPGKSQQVFITFNFKELVTGDYVKFVQYGDDSTYFKLYTTGGEIFFSIGAATSAGDQTIPQSSWNIDKLDGKGKSRLTLDLTKIQIFVLDFQALYTGRVRMGFNIDGEIIYCHEFNNANVISYPYIQTANLPIRAGMTTDVSATTDMLFICCTVNSEDSHNYNAAYQFSASSNVTAGDATRTHLFSIQPRTTFNSIVNRAKIDVLNMDILVTGNQPVFWELCIGQALTTPTTANVNTSYSTVDKLTVGTLSGSPGIVIDSGYVPATNQVKGVLRSPFQIKFPITLNKAGAVRDLGRVTLLVQGIGGASDCYASLTWMEVR